MTAAMATELRQSKTGAIIDNAIMNTVQVTRNNRSVVVLISTKEYESLQAVENAYWDEMANMQLT